MPSGKNHLPEAVELFEKNQRHDRMRLLQKMKQNANHSSRHFLPLLVAIFRL
jgi:hypothetical protein